MKTFPTSSEILEAIPWCPQCNGQGVKILEASHVPYKCDACNGNGSEDGRSHADYLKDAYDALLADWKELDELYTAQWGH
jgi:hypothetical protein